MVEKIKNIVLKEFQMEIRQKFALAGILLYVFSTIYVCYLSFQKIVSPPVWNALFWIILLFASVNAITKSFLQESRGRQLYYYTIYSPKEVILGKFVYNTLVLVVLGTLSYLVYSLFITDLVQDHLFFLISLICGCVAFSGILTLVSAIASKTSNNFSLMAILSFPLLIPALITVIKTSKYAVDGLDRSLSAPYFLVLLLINVIIVILSYILFPYLWRE